MKVEVERLRKMVGLVQPIAKSSHYQPNLGHVLLKAESNKLTVGGTNLDAWISVTSETGASGNMAISVPAKLFSDYLGTIEDEFVKLSVEEKTMTLTIESKKDIATMKGMPGDEFPALPEHAEDERLHLTQTALLSMTDRTVFAAATDETRPILTAILLKADGTTVKAVATDGYRLSEYVQAQDWESEEMTALIPAKAFAILTNVCKAYPEDVVKMTFSEMRAQFEVGEVLFSTSLIAGDYPEYGSFIPTGWDTKLPLDSDDVKKLLQAVKALGLFTHILKVEIGEGGLQLSVASLEEGSGETVVACKVEGEDLTFGISAKYLAEALQACKGQPLEIWLTKPSRPVLLVQDGFQHVIMPMHLTEAR